MDRWDTVDRVMVLARFRREAEDALADAGIKKTHDFIVNKNMFRAGLDMFKFRTTKHATYFRLWLPVGAHGHA